MYKKLSVKYNVWIIIIFSLIEVFLFNEETNLTILISILEYLFVFFVFFINRESGLMYFFSFILLTIGAGNYSSLDIEPMNFWGMRFAGVSLSTLITILMGFFVILYDKFSINYFNNIYYKFFLFFFLYSLFIGIITYALGINYLDNFVNDIKLYFTSIFYIVLLNKISLKNKIKIITYIIPLTVFQLLLSFLFNKKFAYGIDEFLLQNSIYLFIPILLLMFRKWYNNYIWGGMLIIMFFFMITNQYFIAGKFIIVSAVAILLYVQKNKTLFFVLIIPLIITVLNAESILLFFENFFRNSDAKTITFKFSQVRESITSLNQIDILASSRSSIGNLAAELLNIIEDMKHHFTYFLFGKGLGGGVNDYYGYLAPWAGTSGYRTIDASRNLYYRLHLPIYEVILKGGIIFLVYYIIILVKSFKYKNELAFLFIFVFFFTFTVSKEEILLTLIIIEPMIYYNNIKKSIPPIKFNLQ